MNYLFFWHEYEANRELSNWFPSEFIIDCFEYQHVEQYFMSQKARIFQNPKIHTKILLTRSPKECKALGRRLGTGSMPLWNTLKYDIMKTAVREKFPQNENLQKFLLNTGDKILVEASPYDIIWGIGLSVKDAIETPPISWPGRNLLGEILMEVRAELREY